MANVTPANFRIHRRIAASRILLTSISDSQKKGGYEPHGGPQNIPNAAFIPNSARQEIILLHCEHAALLRRGFDFPEADTYNIPVLEAVDQAVADWKLVNVQNSSDLVILLQILYNAAQLTFNSPRVFRHLITTLIQFGDCHEARLALNTYIGLIQRQMETQEAHHPSDSQEEKPAPLPPPKNEDQESIRHIIDIIATGSKLVLVAFNDATESLRLHKLGHKLLQKYPNQVTPQLVAQIHLWKGTTHGHIAANAVDREIRLEHHQKAIDHLNIADQSDPNNIDILVQLAFQHASGGRDIATAFTLARKAVNINQGSIRAWHLLVLLITARKDYVGALRACDLALKRSGQWWAIDKELHFAHQKKGANSNRHHSKFIIDSNKGGSDTPSSVDSPTSRSQSITGTASAAIAFGPIEEGIEYISLKLTQSLIRREVDGVESALRSHTQAFLLYGRLMGAMKQRDIDDASYAVLMTSNTMSLPNFDSRAGRRNSFTAMSLGSNGGGDDGDVRAALPSYRSTGKGIAHSLAQSIKSGRGIMKSFGQKNVMSSTASLDGTDKNKFTRRFRKSMHILSHHSHGEHNGGRERSASTSKPKANAAGPLGMTSPAQSQSVEHFFNDQVLRSAPALDQQALFHHRNSQPLIHDQSQSPNTPEPKLYYKPIVTRLRLLNKQAARLLCDMWLFSANSFNQISKFEDAMQAAGEAATADPDSPSVFAVRGQIYLKQDKIDEATTEFNSAFAIAPGETESTICLARTKCNTGKKEIAAGLLVSLTSGKGWNNPEAWYWLGVIERKLAQDLAEDQQPSPPSPLQQATANAETVSPLTQIPLQSSSSSQTFYTPLSQLPSSDPTTRPSMVATHRVATDQSGSTSEGFTGYADSHQQQQQQIHASWNRAKEYLAYALDMEQTQPIRSFECLAHMVPDLKP